MGDRTTCTLDVYGDVNRWTDETIGTLSAFIKDAWVEEFSTEKEIREELEAGGGNFTFHDINYGDIDWELEEFLRENQISYVWYWDHGGAYSAGFTFFDGNTSECFQCGGNQWEPTLTVRDLDNSKFLADIRKWTKWMEAQTLVEKTC